MSRHRLDKQSNATFRFIPLFPKTYALTLFFAAILLTVTACPEPETCDPVCAKGQCCLESPLGSGSYQCLTQCEEPNPRECTADSECSKGYCCRVDSQNKRSCQPCFACQSSADCGNGSKCENNECHDACKDERAALAQKQSELSAKNIECAAKKAECDGMYDVDPRKPLCLQTAIGCETAAEMIARQSIALAEILRDCELNNHP